MNTPQSTPEDNELIRAFQCYYWIIVNTNPIIDKLPLVEAPSYIKDQISEFQEIGEVEKESNTLSSYATNILLLRFVGKEIPLFKVGGKEISCVADIKKLWDTLGIKSSKHDFYFYRKVCISVMAYLEPQYLKIEKELMAGLEPEKQSKALDVPQDKPGKDFVPFSTPEGTQWHEVKISFIDEENVSLKIREGRPNKMNYAEMGFKDKRGNKPLKLWNRLEQFAKNNGLITSFSKQEKNILEKDVQRLRNKLRECFKIDGDPIPYIEKEGYKTTFQIKHKEHETISGNPNEKECSTCKDKHKNICILCSEYTETCKGCHNELVHNQLT